MASGRRAANGASRLRDTQVALCEYPTNTKKSGSADRISRHGTPIRYTNEGEGSHWISAKLYQNAPDYFRIIELEIGK